MKFSILNLACSEVVLFSLQDLSFQYVAQGGVALSAMVQSLVALFAQSHVAMCGPHGPSWPGVASLPRWPKLLATCRRFYFLRNRTQLARQVTALSSGHSLKTCPQATKGNLEKRVDARIWQGREN